MNRTLFRNNSGLREFLCLAIVALSLLAGNLLCDVSAKRFTKEDIKVKFERVANKDSAEKRFSYTATYRINNATPQDTILKMDMIVEPNEDWQTQKVYESVSNSRVASGNGSVTKYFSQTWVVSARPLKSGNLKAPSVTITVPDPEAPDSKGDVSVLTYDFVNYVMGLNEKPIEYAREFPGKKELSERYSLVFAPDKEIYSIGDTVTCRVKLVVVPDKRLLLMNTNSFFGKNKIKIGGRKLVFVYSDDSEAEVSTEKGEDCIIYDCGHVSFVADRKGEYKIPSYKGEVGVLVKILNSDDDIYGFYSIKEYTLKIKSAPGRVRVL